MKSSLFSMEIAARIDRAPNLLPMLRAAVANQPPAIALQQKWQAYRTACEALLGNLGAIERGCWDYFDDHSRAEKDFKMWLGGMTTEEGARKQPSSGAQGGPYRGEPRYLTFTMTFLMVSPSPSDSAMSRLCTIPDRDLWRREVFGRLLAGMGVINFASVQSDVMYLLPRDESWGLTADDLAEEKFKYLRPLS